MFPSPRLAGDLRSLLLLVATTAIWSLQLQTLLVERSFSSQFWPDDIQAVVIRLLGGTWTPSVISGFRCSLGWFSVFSRCLLVTGACFMTARLICGRVRGRQRISGPDGVAIDPAASLFPGAAFAGIWLLLWYLAPLLPEAVEAGVDTLLTTAAPVTPGLSIALLAVGCLQMFAAARSAGGLVSSGEATDSRASGVCAPGLRGRLWRMFPPGLLLAVVCWQSTSFLMNSRLYDGLLVPHGDSAMYEEHLWNVWHGKGFRSYLDQGLFPGEHIQLIHLLLLPLHMLWPHYLLLEWFSSACLAAAAVPVYRMTLRHTGCRRAAFWLGLSWLLFTPMHFLDIAIDLKTLRPSCYGLLALFCFIDQAECGHRGRASLCFLLALVTQEDFALITGPLAGLLCWLQRPQAGVPNDRRQQFWSGGLAAASVVWVLLAVLVVIPAFRGGEVVHYSRYFGDLGSSPSELIRTGVTEPGRVAAILCSRRTLLYLLLLTGPLGFLCWKNPLRLLAGLPTFAMLSLIQLGSSGGDAAAAEFPPIPFHHFHAPLLPVLFWAAAAGLGTRPASAGAGNAGGAAGPGEARRVKGSRPTLFGQTWIALRQLTATPAHAARFACLCAAGTALTGSIMPCGAAFWSEESPFGWSRLYVPGARAREFPKVLARIPATARVASTDFVHTRLTHFDRSWDYSDYPRAVNQYQPGVPADTDFIVIDTSHPYSKVRAAADVRELREQPEKWELLPDDTGGLFLILHRRDSAIAPLPASTAP